jgi:single-strand DNA-binding protein
MIEIKGKIKLIGQTQTHGSGFQKREIVVTTQEQYPQDIKIEFVKDKCEVLDKYKPGQEVTVGINIRGNEFKGKYYVSLQGWKISTQAEIISTQAEGAWEKSNRDLPF